MEVKVKLVPSGVDEDGEDQFLELDEAIIATLTPLLREAVAKKTNAVSNEVIKAVVEERVAVLSVEAFAGAFQATDSWGKSKGEAKSLPEIVSGKVMEYLQTRVDQHGRPGYGSDKPTRCDWMVRGAIQAAIDGEIGKQLGTLRAEFAERIAAKLAKVQVT